MKKFHLHCPNCGDAVFERNENWYTEGDIETCQECGMICAVFVNAEGGAYAVDTKEDDKVFMICGYCQKIYQRVEGLDGCLMYGQPDLESIIMRIDRRDIPGTDINICPACARDALLGRRGFRRRGNICEAKP